MSAVEKCAEYSPFVSSPAVDALYRSTYPEYLQYIYLVAPVSLMLLNPIGFALCEVQRWKQALQPQRSSLLILGVVVLQVHTGVCQRSFFLCLHLCKALMHPLMSLLPVKVMKNPIVFMVIVGIISHFALGQRIPAVLSEFIDGLANSFGGAALFYLGLTMVSGSQMCLLKVNVTI